MNKRILSFGLVLCLIFAMGANAFADSVQVTKPEVDAVLSAYYEAINAEGDSDVKYNELHEIACNIKEALARSNRSSVEADCILLYGDTEGITDEELLEKTDNFLEYVIEADGDKLSALMRRFEQMDTVSGIIEPTKVSIEVVSMYDFAQEIGLSYQIIGYVLAMLDNYDYSWIGGEEFLQFTDTGFTFNWAAVGPYELTLTDDSSVSNYTELARGSKGEDVVRLQERLNELGFSVGTADGDYGKKTEFAIRDFQERNGLTVTGIADVETLETLYSDTASATHFGFTVDEFITKFFQSSDKHYRIADESGSYNVYGGYGDIDASFIFGTDSLGHVTSISLSGKNTEIYGQEQVLVCIYAFGVVHPEYKGKALAEEFARICGTYECVVEDGIKYDHWESSRMGAMYFTMEAVP